METIPTYLIMLVLGAIIGVLGHKQRLKTLEKVPNMDLYLNDFRIMDLYEAINSAINTNQKRLTFVVTELSTETFAEVYHSLKNNNLKVELRCSRTPQGKDVEYLDFDFSNYSGPRNSKIKPIWDRVATAKAMQSYKEYFNQEEIVPRSNLFFNPHGNIIPLFSKPSEKKIYTDNVITVDFRNKKVVS